MKVNRSVFSTIIVGCLLGSAQFVQAGASCDELGMFVAPKVGSSVTYEFKLSNGGSAQRSTFLRNTIKSVSGVRVATIQDFATEVGGEAAISRPMVEILGLVSLQIGHPMSGSWKKYTFDQDVAAQVARLKPNESVEINYEREKPKGDQSGLFIGKMAVSHMGCSEVMVGVDSYPVIIFKVSYRDHLEGGSDFKVREENTFYYSPDLGHSLRLQNIKGNSFDAIQINMPENS